MEIIKKINEEFSRGIPTRVLAIRYNMPRNKIRKLIKDKTKKNRQGRFIEDTETIEFIMKQFKNGKSIKNISYFLGVRKETIKRIIWENSNNIKYDKKQTKKFTPCMLPVKDWPRCRMSKCYLKEKCEVYRE